MGYSHQVTGYLLLNSELGIQQENFFKTQNWFNKICTTEVNDILSTFYVNFPESRPQKKSEQQGNG